MKVMITREAGISEDYAEIHCKEETPVIWKLADYIEAVNMKITGSDSGSVRLLNLSEIFYFESVEKKTFAYLEGSVWEVEMALREAEENHRILGFVRVSKSIVVNLYKVAQMKNDFEMRMLLEMENGETLVMNRHYRKNFQKCLDEIKESLMGGSNETDAKK